MGHDNPSKARPPAHRTGTIRASQRANEFGTATNGKHGNEPPAASNDSGSGGIGGPYISGGDPAAISNGNGEPGSGDVSNFGTSGDSPPTATRDNGGVGSGGIEDFGFNGNDSQRLAVAVTATSTTPVCHPEQRRRRWGQL